MNLLSKRAKVTSDKPAYKEKKKTDKGYVWVYDEKHVEKRWEEKKDKLKKLEKELDKVRKQYREDLKSDDERTKAIAAIVGIMDETAMRIGNEESAREGTYGASTLKVKHVKGGSGKMTFDFPGKGEVEQNVVLENNEVIKAIRDLMKGKKADDFIFEIDGKKIWDRAVNRYLKPFDISAKDLRGFHANRLMKEMLKKKDFKEALEEVADIVGHKASTLKNQYLDPELVEKHEGKEEKKEKKAFSIRAQSYMEEEELPVSTIKHTPTPPVDVNAPVTDPSRWENYAQLVDVNKNVTNVYESATLTPSIERAWRIIAPFMPNNTYLSSAYRGAGEQAKIVLEYWRSYAGKPGEWKRNQGVYHTTFSKELGITDQELRVMYWKAVNDKDFNRREKRRLNQMVSYIRNKSPKGVQVPDIAFVGESEHQEGVAFDITGSNLRAINKTLMEVAAAFPGSIQVISSLVEPANNAIHVVLGSSVVMPPMKDFVAALYQKQQPRMVKRQSLSVRALTEQHTERVREMKEKLSPSVSVVPKEEGGVQLSEDQRKALNISPRAKINETILSAWAMLSPFLPPGARLTSGSRTLEDQTKIIENAWKRYRANIYYPTVTDPAQKARILTKQFRYIVGPPKVPEKHPAHLKGTAFDVSGADLNAIARAVKVLSGDKDVPVRMTAKIEPVNNAVHVNIYEAKFDPQALTSAKQRYLGRAYAEPEYYDQITIAPYLYEDMVASGVPNEIVSKFADAFKIAHNQTVPDLIFEINNELNDEDMGHGEDDEMGDWFEKAPIFRHRDEEEPEHDIHDVSDNEAKQLAENDPDAFFYRGLHKECPEEEALALKNMLEDNAKFYFVFKYHEREEDEFKELLEAAAEALSQQDARAFFYYHLHHKFPELGRGAIVQLVDTNPDSFFDLGLDKDYPDYIESANNARNIKDPNKMELELPEWAEEMVSKKSLSIRDGVKKLSKRDEKKKDRKHGAGVFILLPKDMSKQFPSLGEHDDSATHVTVLYIGDVPEKKQETVYGVVRDVIKDFSPIKLELDKKPTYFPATKHSDNCKIAKMAVVSKELHKLHKALKKALIEAGVEVDDHFPSYKPHVTLEYMEPPKEKFDGEVPSGSWTANHVQVWSCGNKKRIPFGKKSLSKRADYNAWWFSPDGKLYDAPNGHILFIKDHPEFFGYFGPDEEPTYEDALSKGWMRVAKMDMFSTFDVPGALSDSYLKTIQNVLEKMPPHKSIRIEDNRNVLDVPYEMVMFYDSVAKLKRDSRFASSKPKALSKRAGRLELYREMEGNNVFENTVQCG